MVPALIIGAHTVGLSVIRALGSQGVPVVVAHYDDKDMGQVSKYVQESIPCPHPEKDADQFMDFLLERASRLGGGLWCRRLTPRCRRCPGTRQHSSSTTSWDARNGKSPSCSWTRSVRTPWRKRAGVPAPKTVSPAFPRRRREIRRGRPVPVSGEALTRPPVLRSLSQEDGEGGESRPDGCSIQRSDPSRLRSDACKSSSPAIPHTG